MDEEGLISETRQKSKRGFVLDILKRIFNYSARYRKQFVFAIILVMMLIGINLVLLLFPVIVDDVVKGGQRCALAYGRIAYGISCKCHVYLGACFLRIIHRTIYDLRNDIYTSSAFALFLL